MPASRVALDLCQSIRGIVRELGKPRYLVRLLGAALSWSFTTLTVAAKNIMVSVPDYLLIETAFTLVQWAIVSPLTVFAFSRIWRGAVIAAA